ncbi:tautomerase family protein [Mucilaginibacter aquaedulcis]|jgi:phenylpyruvate tautomerase PptA (4-oxalocrotonate tautomerase family)|uniref:tautomerase family protein n=1 Tax=Mucilaginibacter aquaedulcis TaxID=1187081 RepID=UPI0025B51443|nr:tautomerase family protein [Mucilaginibacter aquaedulcis]MDN3551658.1 tautomerase family protein [Mucilaginibacter aquaedulcis]
MPFVRISLLKTLSASDKDKISKAVHQSLMAEFNVPADDYFHVIEELDAGQLYYPKNYLGIAHSGNMVYVQITAGSGRSYEQKERLYAAIAGKIAAETPVLINDVIIILVENGGKENWSFGEGKIQNLSHIKTDKQASGQ